MRIDPSLRRWLSAGLTFLVFGAIVAAVAYIQQRASADKQSGIDAPAATATAWPLFGGTVQRNLVNTFEKNLPAEWNIEEKEHIKWVAELGSRSYGGPVLAGGKIFVGTNNENPRDKKITGDKGVILCLKEATGEMLWQAVHDKLPAGRVVDWPLQGICSSPVVEGNRLYYVTNRCEVICADTEGMANGNQGVTDETYKGPDKADFLWRLDMMKELGVFPHNLATCSPLVVGDLLFTLTSNGVDEGHINIPAPAAPSFLALDKKTGKVLWKDNSPSKNLLAAREKGEANIKGLVDRGLVLMHGQWSNPVYTEVNGQGQIIFPGGDGWLYAFEPKTGKLIWKFDANPKDSIYVLGPKSTRNDFVCTPVIHQNRLYIGVGQDPEHNEGVGHLWCVDLTKKGDVSPELVTDDTNLPPKTKPNPNSAAVWHYGGFVPAADRAKVKRPYYFGRTLSTCAVHDGLVYVGELNGWFHCLDAKTGQVKWEHNMNASTWSSPYCVDGKVYLGNDDDRVLVFAQGPSLKLLAENEMDGKVRATPVACNGVLYVMTENKLYAIK